jgi:hypothetical protein
MKLERYALSVEALAKPFCGSPQVLPSMKKPT